MLNDLIQAFTYTAPLWIVLIGLFMAVVAIDGMN
jgi:hypothetical protein